MWPFNKLLGPRKTSLNDTLLSMINRIYGYPESKSGETVTWKSALEVTTVLACCKVLANGVKQVPWRVYRSEGEGRITARDHPLHDVIGFRPNSWQTPSEFIETVMFHRLLTGNAFVWIGRVGSARRVSVLEPIEPHRVAVERDDPSGALTYTVTADDGSRRVFPASDIWHLRGPSWNGWMGMDAVRLAREAIGLAMATEGSHASLHRNGSKVSGVLSVQGQLSEERFELLSKWLDKHAAGGDRENKPLVIDDGGTWTSLTMTGVDAQHIETRKHQIEEICRAFNVMPIMVGHPDKTATYASSEQMFIAHVVHTLTPHYVAIEQSANINLLGDTDRRAGYYTKFSPNGLMRGAANDRSEFYAKALGSGGSPPWMTQNEVRALEELNPVEGGDALIMPVTAAAPDPTPPAN